MSKVFYKVYSYDAKTGRYSLRPTAKFTKDDLIACVLGLGVSALIFLGCSIEGVLG